MLYQKVFEEMNAAKERIIKTMQERGLTEVTIFPTEEEYEKQHENDPDAAEWYEAMTSNAPDVTYYDKNGDGINYEVLKVTLESHPVIDVPRFKLDCYNSDYGSDTFHDHSLAPLEMLNVYDTLEEALELKDEPQEVWVFVATQACDFEMFDPITKAFATEDEARAYLKEFVDGDEGERAFAQKYGWIIANDDPDHFEAYEDGCYCQNHTEAEIRKETITKSKED